jgi:hypothetical protein
MPAIAIQHTSKTYAQDNDRQRTDDELELFAMLSSLQVVNLERKSVACERRAAIIIAPNRPSKDRHADRCPAKAVSRRYSGRATNERGDWLIAVEAGFTFVPTHRAQHN